MHVKQGDAYVQTRGLKKRDRRGEKAVIYTPPSPLCFDFSFSSAKIMCILIRTLKVVEDHEKEMKRRRKSGYFPFALLFPMQKDMCIFIHIYSFGIYVHTWGRKRRDRMGEKAGIYTLPQPPSFGSSLSPAKKMCIFMHTKTHRTGQRTCAYMADGKRGEEGAKRRMFFPHTKRGRRPCEKGKELRRYPLFALLFVFLCFAFLWLFCLSFRFKKNGKEEGEKRRTATTTAVLQDIRERWRKGNLKRGWR